MTVEGLYHRVGRVLGFLSTRVVRTGTPPTPHSQVPRGGGTLACERAGGGSQFQRWDRHWGTLFIYVLCGLYIPRVPECLSLRPNWLPPPPLPPASVSPPGTKGGQHSLAGEGAGGEPIRTTEEKAWHSFYSVSVTNKRNFY